MISSIKAMLAVYSTIVGVQNIPVFMGMAPPEQVEPYCVYSAIPSINGLQGAYGTPAYLENTDWQWAFYAIGKDTSNMAQSLVLLEIFIKGMDAHQQLSLTDANAVALSFRRTGPPAVMPMGWDNKTSQQRFQALAKYELLNQNQFGLS